jgi:hypothetical protein
MNKIMTKEGEAVHTDEVFAVALLYVIEDSAVKPLTFKP